MIQRNATNYTLVLPTTVPPVEVPPGWEIDHPELLAGFEPVEQSDDAAADPASGDEPAAPVDAEPADPAPAVDSTPADQAPNN